MRLVKLAGKFISREWRAGELRILFMALIIAVGCLSSIGFIANRMQQAMAQQSAELLGGDIVATSPNPISPTWIKQAQQLNLNTALTVEFPSMISQGEQLQLATVKAVDDHYPLLGKLETKIDLVHAAIQTKQGPPAGEIWLEPRLFSSMHIQPNTKLTLGRAQFSATRLLSYEPDYSFGWFNIAPRLLMNYTDLTKTAILQPGSRAEYRLLITGSANAIEQYSRWLKLQLTSSQKLIDSKTAQTRLANTVEQIDRYLKLASLICIVLAGIAIATATHRYSSRHYTVSSLLRCFGLQQQQIVTLYSLQFLIVGIAGSILGCLLGLLGQALLATLVNNLLQLKLPAPQIYPALSAICTGLLALFSFALPPVLNLKEASPLMIIRREPIKTSASGLLIYGIGGLGVFTLLLLYTQDLKLSSLLGFGLGCTLLALFILTSCLIKLIQRLRPHIGMNWRYGLASLARHGQNSRLQIITFGAIIMLVQLLILVRYDLLANWQQRLPAKTPNFFAINIAPTEVSDIKRMLDQAKISHTDFYPMVRGRLIALNGKPVLEAIPEASRSFNALHRELNLSWKTTAWPDQHHWVSIEASLATALNAKPGDTLSFQIGSDKVTATIYQTRSVDWYAFQPNFYVIFSPNALQHMPATYISSFYLASDSLHFTQQLVEKFPSITLIDIRQVLTQISRVIDRASLIIGYLLAFTLVVSLVILYSSLHATLDQRIYESAILRTLGVRQKHLQQSLAVEFITLGLVAGIVGSFGATLAAYVLAKQLFNMAFQIQVTPILIGPLLGALLIGIAGLLATRVIFKRPPILLLKG